MIPAPAGQVLVWSRCLTSSSRFLSGAPATFGGASQVIIPGFSVETDRLLPAIPLCYVALWQLPQVILSIDQTIAVLDCLEGLSPCARTWRLRAYRRSGGRSHDNKLIPISSYSEITCVRRRPPKCRAMSVWDQIHKVSSSIPVCCEADSRP